MKLIDHIAATVHQAGPGPVLNTDGEGAVIITLPCQWKFSGISRFSATFLFTCVSLCLGCIHNS